MLLTNDIYEGACALVEVPCSLEAVDRDLELERQIQMRLAEIGLLENGINNYTF